MDDVFDDSAFETVTTPVEEPKPAYNNNRGNSGGFKPYPKRDPNIIGTNKINLWNKDEVVPVEINLDNLNKDKKIATLVLPDKTFTPNETGKDKFKTILNLLKEKGFEVRFICNYIRGIHKEVIEIMGTDKVTHITPWATYCKDADKDTKLYLPSDANLQAAAHYFKGFQNFHNAFKHIKASIIFSLYGYENNEPSSFVITLDPFYTSKKIDFTKSRDTADYYLIGKHLPTDVYNINNDSDMEDLRNLLK